MYRLPVAVPLDTVDRVTTTFLARVPFRTDTVTLTLLASSSRTEYDTGSNPIVTTGGGENIYLTHTHKYNILQVPNSTYCHYHL